MKLRLFIGGIAVLALVGGLVWFKGAKAPEISAAPANVAAVVTVKQTGVFKLSGEEKVRLFTGDEVTLGTVIVTDETGRAELEFPNGSIARLDSNTTLTLESIVIDEASGTTNTSLFLKIGRVWSRVAKLATPASSWEVKTSNIVAAVRGTAFNVGVTRDGKHRLLVDEDTVLVKTVNPETGAVIAEAEVTEEKFAEIDAASAEAFPPEIEVTDPPKEIAEDAWVKENRIEDRAVEKKLQEREKTFKERAEVFENRLKEEGIVPEAYFEELKVEIQELSKSEEAPSEKKPEALETPKQEPLPIRRETLEGGSGAGSQIPGAKIERLRLKALNPQSAYFEHADVSFTLIAVFSDGSERDVTSAASWSVSGPIGSIVKPGTLRTEITDLLVAETGKAEGAITASFSGLRVSEGVIVLPPTLEELPNDRG